MAATPRPAREGLGHGPLVETRPRHGQPIQWLAGVRAGGGTAGEAFYDHFTIAVSPDPGRSG